MTEIVLATRLGTESAAPTQVARELARDLGAHVTLVYAATDLDALTKAGGEAGIDLAAERERVEREARAGLEAFAREYFPDQPDVALRIEHGDAADVVTRVAAEVNARLLVVGTRGRGTLARLVLGDTTQNILQRTPCPVVVVPLAEPSS